MAARKPARKTKTAPKKKPVAKKKVAAPKKKAAAKKPAAKKVAVAKKSAPMKAAAPMKTKPAPKATRPVTTADGGHHLAPVAAAPREETIPSGMVSPGTPAPDVTLLDEHNQPVRLTSLRGQNVIVYFYPRDNTPGCTIEAQEFSSLLPEFAARNAIVLGVSTDSAESHRRFKHMCDLSVRLLADVDRRAHNAFGTWREKNMYGKKVMGTQRSTFLIDASGQVSRVWPKVKPENHALEVLNAIGEGASH